jgi:hypothetical protein
MLGDSLLRRLSFFVLFALVVFEFAPVAAQKSGDAPAASAPVSPAPYRVGERLTYDVTFANFVSAAHIETFVAARGSFFDREGLQLRCHVETTGIVSATLYALNNDYTTYVDPQTGLPYRSQQLVRESGRSTNDEIDLNASAGTDAIPAKRSSAFPGVFDFVSALFRVRAFPLAERASYSISVRSDSTQYDAEVKVVGHEMVKSNVGTFNTVVTEVRAIGNSHVNDFHIRAYFSDDQRHVPVLITLQLKSGDLRVELAGTEFVKPEGPTVPVRPTPAPAPKISVANSSPSSLNLPFSVGEQLNYNVFLGQGKDPVAATNFQVKSRAKFFNKDGLLLTIVAKTNGVLAKLFSANDLINSYVDPSTLVPFRTELQLQEGNRRVNEIVTIDQDRGTALNDKGKKIEIPVGTHDILSVFYALRAFNLNPPKRNAVSLLVNNRPLTLFVTSLKREKIQINGQSIGAIQLSLTTDDPQSDKYALRLWIGDDRRRIPLRITATTELGALRADLAIIPISQQ